MDILSRLHRGYKHIPISICRYAHAYLLYRCFDQLFALMEWSNYGLEYVSKMVPRYRLFQHRDVSTNYFNIAEYRMCCTSGIGIYPRKIVKRLACYRYPSGEEHYTKVVNHRYNPTVHIPARYITDMLSNALVR
jgi:hypothetical protein